MKESNQFVKFNSREKELIPINCHTCKGYDIIPCVLVPDLEIMFLCNQCNTQFKVSELEMYSKIDDNREKRKEEFKLLLGEVTTGITKYIDRVLKRGSKHYEGSKKR